MPASREVDPPAAALTGVGRQESVREAEAIIPHWRLSTSATEMHHHLQLNHEFRSDLQCLLLDGMALAYPSGDAPDHGMVRCLRYMGLLCLHYTGMVSWSLAGFMVPGEHYCQGAIINCAGVSDMGSTVVRKHI